MRTILSTVSVTVAMLGWLGNMTPVPSPFHSPPMATTHFRNVVPDSLRGQIELVAFRYRISPLLLAATAYQENRFKPKGCSKAGACGLMQFMARTADQYKVDVNDPLSSLDGAARYLVYLLNLHDGNTGLALASYNWGEGNVTKWLAGKAKMPRETRDYVYQITGMSVQEWSDGTRHVAGGHMAMVARDFEG